MISYILDTGAAANTFGLVLMWMLESWAIFLVINFMRYAIPCGLTFLIFSKAGRKRWAHRQIQGKLPPRAHVRREFLHSMTTVTIFGLMSLLTGYLAVLGVNHIYINVSDYDLGIGLGGWGFWLFSLVTVIVVHDAYFYFTHWALHHRWFYRRFHLLHHRSTNPSSWAAYSFTPTEATIHGLYIPLISLVLPLHPLTLFLFMYHMMFRNAFQHCGVEFFPKGFNRHWFGKWHTTPTHHDLHHRRVTGNYAFYFTWWDRLFGTLREEHDAVYDEVTSRAKGTPPTDATAIHQPKKPPRAADRPEIADTPVAAAE